MHRSDHSGQITNAGSATEAVQGNVEQLTFAKCGAAHVVVLKNGSGEVTTQGASANSNGILYGAGSEVTVSVTALGTSCVYGTGAKTQLGTVTGSTTTGGTAKFDVSSSLPLIKQVTGFGCANPASWTATYKVTSPDWLDVD